MCLAASAPHRAGYRRWIFLAERAGNGGASQSTQYLGYPDGREVRAAAQGVGNVGVRQEVR
jgi:hypothetical protein